MDLQRQVKPIKFIISELTVVLHLIFGDARQCWRHGDLFVAGSG